MNKVSQYLQEHLTGEVLSDIKTRQLYSHDKSLLEILPLSVVWPRDENDVRKLVRFVWQLAERGRVLPITARGLGNGENGSAIGQGIVIDFSKHLNRILVLDPKKKYVTVESGAQISHINQVLATHSLAPKHISNYQDSSIGGLFNTNVGFDGSGMPVTASEVCTGIRAILSNGEAIEVSKLSKKGLSQKLGLNNFEGEIYRQLDKLLEENAELVGYTARRFDGSVNTAGYNVYGVKQKDGGFDLTQLLAGSEGTLAILTESKIELEVTNPEKSLVLASFDSLAGFADFYSSIVSLKPSSIFYVSEGLVSKIENHFPNYLDAIIPQAKCAFHVLVELSNPKASDRKKIVKKLKDKLNTSGAYCTEAKTYEEKAGFAKLVFLPQLLETVIDVTKKPIPVAGGISVPISKTHEAISEVFNSLKSLNQLPIIWGSGTTIYFKPMLDISNVGDRQKAFKLMDETFASAIHYGGSFAANGEGRLRAPYSTQLFPEEMNRLFAQIKNIFDPHGILNPGVKLGITAAQSKALLRKIY